MLRKLLRFAPLLTVAGLTACGGGGSDGGSNESDVSANGIWQGTTTEEGITFQTVALVYEGQIFTLSDSGVIGNGGYGISGSSLNGTITTYDGAALGNAELDLTVREQTSITGSFETTYNTSGTVNLSYDELYERDVSTADLDANWTFSDGTGYTATIPIASDGTFTNGTDTDGCIYSGSLELAESGKNLFDVQVTVASCGTVNGGYTGFATLADTNSENDTLIFAVSNSQYVVLFGLERN